MIPPGRWLRRLAGRVYTTRTLERLIDPVVADMQLEHERAVQGGRSTLAAWIRVRGYAAFWSAIGLHALETAPRAVREIVAADGWLLFRLVALSAGAAAGVTLLLSAPPMLHDYSRHASVELALLAVVPQAVPLSIPVAVSLAIVCTVGRRQLRARSRVVVLAVGVVAALMTFLAMRAIPLAREAWRTQMAQELRMRGITSFELRPGAIELSLPELQRGIAESEAGGAWQRARRLQRALHMRLAFPAAAVVLSLLALGIAGTLQGRAQRVGALAGALGLYWIVLALAEQSALVPAVLAVWAPNLALTAMALGLLRYRPNQ